LCPIGDATVITTIFHPLGCIIGVSSKGGWGWGLRSRRWCDFGVDDVLLARLLFFIRVTEDDDLVVARRHEETAVEVAEEPPSEILIS
jgi:hypothetical protein